MSNKTENREMELCRGTRMVGAEWRSEDSKMFQFLSIFHPEMSIQKRINLIIENRMEKQNETL